MLRNLRNELTTGNIGNNRIRTDSFLIYASFSLFKQGLQMFHTSLLTATDNFGRNCFVESSCEDVIYFLFFAIFSEVVSFRKSC